MAYFFGGARLASTLPHLGNGISGHAFQTPFAPAGDNCAGEYGLCRKDGTWRARPGEPKIDDWMYTDLDLGCQDENSG